MALLFFGPQLSMFPRAIRSKEWIVLKDCRLIANPANDGDSFHMSAGENEYLFRLYFVDAPETDEMVAATFR